MQDLSTLSAAEAAKLIREGVITSEALVRASLECIAAREPDVLAWAHLDARFALDQAVERDAELWRGAPIGPLHGVPIGIKDIIDTKHLPTEQGTPVYKGRRPSEDAEVVRRLIAAGAVILGKTETTELAFFGPGRTRNPHDLARTPGGSSSGSAAAVADLHVPLALGTQTAGSIIRPASYCGVIGMKPTFGLIPCEGVLEQSAALDTIGGLARSLQDMALLVSCLAGIPLESSWGRSIRLAFVRSPAWREGEPAMHEAMKDFVSEHRDLVEEIELPRDFATTSGLQRAVQFRDIAKNYGPLLESHRTVLSAKLAEVIAIGRTVSERDYEEALARREPLYVALAPILSRYDAIVTPAAAGPAPNGLASTGSPAFNFLWTYLGMPALTLPLLTVEGLPLGVQLVGARGADAKLIAAASALR